MVKTGNDLLTHGVMDTRGCVSAGLGVSWLKMQPKGLEGQGRWGYLNIGP